jgi:hypothetical protein
MIYLVCAYAFATVTFGGSLAWSLWRVRELEKKAL